MKCHRLLLATLLVFVGTGRLPADDPAIPQPAEPTKEHKWLQQLVGDWTYKSEGIVPGQPPVKGEGTEKVRGIGPIWIVAEGDGKTPDGKPMTTMMTVGFDPAKKKFVASWVCSMMPDMWVYDGSLDATGKILTFEATGPNMMTPGKTSKYRDVIEIKDKNERRLSSFILMDDGKWHQFASAIYRRK